MAQCPRLALSFLVYASCGLVCTAHAEEKRISRAQLPPAVRKIADEQAQGAIVRAYTTDVENGQREYEVEMTLNGHSKDVTIAPDGRLIEIEEQTAPDALPSPVLYSLRRKAGRADIVKVESIAKNGAIVAYEAQLRSSGKRFEIQVGPNGEDLTHEE